MSDLILISEEKFDVIIDSKYAGTDNLTGKVIYPRSFNYLHKEATEKLKVAIELAKRQGYRFKLFDLLRPIEYQRYLFNKFPGPYVSDPETGSIPHCRGVAVDLTLVDAQGKELEMGSGFDELSAISHHGSMEISAEAQRNRYLLMGIMLSSGWDFYQKEWWHYQLYEARNYPVISESSFSA